MRRHPTDSRAMRSYTRLMRAYPSAYRRRFEADMRRAFASELADARARGRWATTIFWIQTVADAARFGLAERRSARATGRRQRWAAGAELRWAWRGLSARRRQAMFGVTLLAVTLGANAVVFSVADSLAFTRTDYLRTDELVILQGRDPATGRTISGLPADLVGLMRANTDLLSAVHATTGSSVLLNRGGAPVSVRVANVTPGLFEMLGARPIAGRTFTDADLSAGSAWIVIREDLAREQFGDPAAAVGRPLETMTGPVHVIGVMPSTFRYQSGVDRAWRPLDLQARPGGRVPSPLVVARMTPGLGLDELQRALADRSPAITVQTAYARGWPFTIAPAPFADRYGDLSTRVYWFLLAAAACLLVTACASIASVELASAVGRTRTFAVAAALGATRGSLLRSVVWEAGMLAAAAAVVAAALAAWGTAAVAAALPDSLTASSTNAIDLDARGLSFMAAAGALTWILAAAPLLHFATRQSSEVLTLDGVRRPDRSAALSRRMLTAAQVAIAVCLLIGAALGVRSYLALTSVDKGFDSANLIGVEVTIPPPMPRTAPAIEATRARVLERLRSLPTVVGATPALEVPPLVWGARYAGPMEIAGQPPGEMAITIRMGVTPDYFRVLRLPLVAGRTFTPADPHTSAIVTETFVEQYWPGTSAIGQRFRQPNDQDWLEIVGVTRRVRSELDRLGAPSRVEHQIFVPFRPLTPAQATTASGAPLPYATVSFAVRLADVSAMGGVLGAVRAIDERLLASAAVVDDLYASLFTDTRVAASVVSAFGVLAFVVALAGICGVMTFLVSGRRREIAIRMALGADGGAVWRDVLGSALRFVLAGAAAGLLAAWGASRAIESQLFGVSPTDPETYAGVAALVIAAAIAAAWQPARRAARVDPAVTLRGL